MRALPQALKIIFQVQMKMKRSNEKIARRKISFPILEIIFQMQMKRSNEKIARRKISFSIHKTRFFSFL
jgi:hypothetical protein